jgi:hypothetical protein
MSDGELGMHEARSQRKQNQIRTRPGVYALHRLSDARNPDDLPGPFGNLDVLAWGKGKKNVIVGNTVVFEVFDLLKNVDTVKETGNGITCTFDETVPIPIVGVRFGPKNREAI